MDLGTPTTQQGRPRATHCSWMPCGAVRCGGGGMVAVMVMVTVRCVGRAGGPGGDEEGRAGRALRTARALPCGAGQGWAGEAGHDEEGVGMVGMVGQVVDGTLPCPGSRLAFLYCQYGSTRRYGRPPTHAALLEPSPPTTNSMLMSHISIFLTTEGMSAHALMMTSRGDFSQGGGGWGRARWMPKCTACLSAAKGGKCQPAQRTQAG